MEIRYRKLFLKDMEKLKTHSIYEKVFQLVFNDLPLVGNLKEIKHIKVMKGYSKRYSIRISDYRVGIELHSNFVDVMRVLHRKEFYRYFP